MPRAVSDLTRKLSERFIEGILPILRTVFEQTKKKSKSWRVIVTKAGAAYTLAKIFDCAEESTHEGGIVSQKQARCLHLSSNCLQPNAGIQTPVAAFKLNRWKEKSRGKNRPTCCTAWMRLAGQENELLQRFWSSANILAVALPVSAPPIALIRKTLGALVSVAGRPCLHIWIRSFQDF